MFLPIPLTTLRIRHVANFYEEYSLFEFRVFLLIWLPRQS